MYTLAAHPPTSEGVLAVITCHSLREGKDVTRYLRHAIGARRLIGGAFGSALVEPVDAVGGGVGDESDDPVSAKAAIMGSLVRRYYRRPATGWRVY